MTDRRQHRRFALEQPLTGELQIAVDVTLEQFSEDGATLLTRTPGLTREPVSLRFMTVGGRVHSAMVRPFKSRPVTIDATLWHRIQAERLDDDNDGGGSQFLPGVVPLHPDDILTCVLMRRAPAYVLQISANGCLLETSRSLDDVRFAHLDLLVHPDERYSAILRICRPGSRVPGSSLARVAAEFVPPYEDSSRPIQQFVAQVEGATKR